MQENESGQQKRVHIAIRYGLTLLAVYVSCFAVLCFDELVLQGHLIRQPIERHAPWLKDPLRNLVQIAYYPEIQIMRAMKLIP